MRTTGYALYIYETCPNGSILNIGGYIRKDKEGAYDEEAHTTAYWGATDTGQVIEVCDMSTLDPTFGMQRVGDFEFVEDSSSKVWCVLDRCTPKIEYAYPNHVHRVLGVKAADNAPGPCISVRKYLVHNARDGSGNKSDQHHTLLLDIAFLHALLEKRAQTRALWRGKSFSNIVTLQVYF